MAKIPINNFDKFIKDKVEMHQTPLDTDRLWSSIQQTGRGRRTGILPGALLFLLVSFFVTIHLLNDSKSASAEGDLKHNNVIASSLSVESVTPVNEINSISSSSLEKNAESKQLPVAIRERKIMNKANLADAEINAVEKQFNKEIQADYQVQRVVEGAEVSDMLFAENNGDHMLESPVSEDLNASSEINSEFLIGEFPLNPTIIESNLLYLSELGNLANKDIAELQTELVFPQMKLSTHAASRIQHAAFKKGFELRLNGGLGKVVRRMERLNPEAEQWMQSRKENEHQLEAIRLGIDMKVRISQNVYFFAGIEDFRINERFDYTSIQRRTYTKDGLAARVVYDENSYITEAGPTEVYEEVRRTGTFYNQFRMINIPLGVGITQQLGRFGLGLEGAILVNAFHQFDGKIADAANVLLDLKDAGLRVNQIQTARINGVFSYQLSSRWGLNLITGADLPLKSVQLGQHMSQKYMVFQGNLGVCYNW